MGLSSRSYALNDPGALAEKIKAAGGPVIDPTQPTGTASGKGVTLSWVIGPLQTGLQITITLVKKPFELSQSFIWEHIDSLFK